MCKCEQPICCGLTAAALPEANDSQTGVSVEYPPYKTSLCYVLRITYGRAEMANEILKALGFVTYMPLQTIPKQ